MRAELDALGVQVVDVGGGVFAVRGADAEWLRAVLVAFGFKADVRVDELRVRTGGRGGLVRAVRAALAPRAVLLDLDGVLVDIARRTRLCDLDEVRTLAERYPLGVVTTCPCRLANSVLERHGLASLVSVVVGSDDGPCKPDPFPVRLALERLGVDVAWMLGDNPSDVMAARGAGVVPLAVAPRGIGAEGHADRLRTAGAVRLVDGIGSLAALLP